MRLSSILFSHLTLKFVSVFIAFILWLYVVTSRDYAYTYTFPVSLNGLSREYTLRYPLPDAVTAKIKGRGRELLFLLRRGGRVDIDASHFAVGSHPISLTSDNFKLYYNGLAVTDIIPKKVNVVLDYIGQKSVPIRSRMVVIPEEGFIVAKPIIFTPPKAMVSGPQKALNILTEVYTVPETIRGLKLPTTTAVAIDTNIADIKFATKNVKAQIRLESISQRTFKGVRVRKRGFPSDFTGTIAPSRLDISVVGDSTSLYRLSASQIMIYVDYRQLSTEGTKRIRPIIMVPEGLRVVSIKPEYLSVE